MGTAFIPGVWGDSKGFLPLSLQSSMDGLVLRKTRKFSGEMDCCSNKKMEDCMESCGSGISGTGKKMKNSRTLASDALPLPVGLTNKVFFILFFTASYFLMRRWREKIRTSTPLHVLSLGELVAIVAQLASFIYLLGFFGIDYVQNFITGGNDDDDAREDKNTTFTTRRLRNHTSFRTQRKGKNTTFTTRRQRNHTNFRTQRKRKNTTFTTRRQRNHTSFRTQRKGKN